jgi:hypothetical protein
MKKLIRKSLMFTVNSWRNVMDVRFNPIGKIPDPSLQLYFTLVLFTMWSVYFGFLASLYLGWVNYNTIMSIVIHLAILIPAGFTNAVFIDAERNGSKWLRDWKAEGKIFDKSNIKYTDGDNT